MRSYNEQLQFHALKDLTNRAKSGVLTYITVFLVMAFTYDLQDIAPQFFLANTIALVLILVSRVVHFITLNTASKPRVGILNQWLVFTVLIAALHWGLMTGWIVYSPELNHLKIVALIICPAFALGGACTLSISSEIRTLYPTLMFAPLVVALVHQGGSENLMLAGMVTFGLLYIFSATRATHNDYWEAITNHMVAEERAELMEKLSTTDPLTQLKNRMYFDSEFSQEWKRSSRMTSPLSLIMVDLDFFKKINDTYGHMHGDDCLRIVATTIAQEAKRPTDCAARYGGEEFVILLPNTNEKGALVIANRILKAVHAINFQINGVRVPLSCSIGGSTRIPNHKQDRTILIKEADEALYHAKNAGRAQYCAFADIDEEAS